MTSVAVATKDITHSKIRQPAYNSSPPPPTRRGAWREEMGRQTGVDVWRVKAQAYQSRSGGAETKSVFGRSSFTSTKPSHRINTSSFRVAVVKNRTTAKTSSGSRSSRLEPPPPPPERCCCRLRELIPSPGAYDVGCAGLSPSAPTSFWQRFPCESSLKDTESGFGEGRSGRYTRHGD